MRLNLGQWALPAIAAVAAFSAAPAIAEGKAPATPVEAGSEIKLFDGATTFGWTNFGDAQWTVENNTLSAAKGTGGWLATNSQFKDFELSVKIKVSRPGTTGIVVRGGLEGHVTDTGGTVVPLGGKEGDPAWQEVKVTALGDKVTATVDGKPVEIAAPKRAAGYIGIEYHAYHDFNSLLRPEKVEVAEVKLKPLHLVSIFDGKTLNGWNIIPGHKSVFAVKDGAINITNGNGEIETEGVYRDFLLQIDILANGKKLNSGVFFRSPKGVFWKGYESQVRNQWVGDDRTKPVDFGTGGIYGVQETRKVVPEDYKWYTMTISAQSDHYAVWVDGYAVADLFDTRPVSRMDDGKNGYVPVTGTINLQGHDPTTDLSFKNINISQY